jgi:hypothetical protein
MKKEVIEWQQSCVIQVQSVEANKGQDTLIVYDAENLPLLPCILPRQTIELGGFSFLKSNLTVEL